MSPLDLDALALVNAAHRCPRACPPSLTAVEDGVLLDRRAARALNALMAAIGGGWREIAAVSGWRSQGQQQALWDRSLAEHGEAFTRRYVALPGHSEHQTGLAVDLGLRQGEIDFIRPYFPQHGLCGLFRARAADHGFILRYPAGKEAVTGIAHEPWHFRYVGAPHAQIMAGRGLTLEEYHALLEGVS